MLATGAQIDKRIFLGGFKVRDVLHSKRSGMSENSSPYYVLSCGCTVSPQAQTARLIQSNIEIQHCS